MTSTESDTLSAALGVPDKYWPVFRRWADEGPNPETRDHVDAFVDVMIAERCWRPGDDLLSELVALEVDGHELTVDELLALVAGLVWSCTTAWVGPNRVHQSNDSGSATAATSVWPKSSPLNSSG